MNKGKISIAAVLSAFLFAISPGLLRAMDMGKGDTMHGMESSENREWTVRDDAAFLSGMIAHHRGALTMSQPLLASRDPQVKQWAEEITVSQRREIGLMEALLNEAGGPDRVAEAMMDTHMREMMAEKLSDDPDVNFTSLMTDHHAQAIEMSVPALALTRNAKVRQLAKDIITAQANEINEFRSWLMTKSSE